MLQPRIRQLTLPDHLPHTYLFSPTPLSWFPIRSGFRVQYNAYPKCTICVAYNGMCLCLYLYWYKYITSYEMPIDRRSRMLLSLSFVTYIGIPHHPVFFLHPSCSSTNAPLLPPSKHLFSPPISFFQEHSTTPLSAPTLS